MGTGCVCPVVVTEGAPGPAWPARVQGGMWAVLTVQVEDEGVLQLEFPDVLLVSLQPLGVPKLSPS